MVSENKRSSLLSYGREFFVAHAQGIRDRG